MKKLADVLFEFLFELKNATEKKDNRKFNDACNSQIVFQEKKRLLDNKNTDYNVFNRNKTIDNSLRFNREKAIDNSFRKFYREKAQGKACAKVQILHEYKGENFNENVIKKYFKGFVGLSANDDLRYDKT